MRWVFDLDGTICDTEYELIDGVWTYMSAKPREDIINNINRLYDMGEYIIVFTARGSLIKREWKEITEAQLSSWGLKYHELKFGKPGAEVYVDDRTITPADFVERFKFYEGIAAKPRHE